MRLVKISNTHGAPFEAWINTDKIVAVTGGILGSQTLPELVGKPWTRIWFGAAEDDHFQFYILIDTVLALLEEAAP